MYLDYSSGPVRPDGYGGISRYIGNERPLDIFLRFFRPQVRVSILCRSPRYGAFDPGSERLCHRVQQYEQEANALHDRLPSFYENHV